MTFRIHDLLCISQEEQEKLEAYFEVLEKKEAMEDQMSKVTKMKVKAVICKQVRADLRL